MPLPGIHPSVSRLSKKGKKIYLSARRNNQRKSGGKRGMYEGGKTFFVFRTDCPQEKEGKEWQNMHS